MRPIIARCSSPDGYAGREVDDLGLGNLRVECPLEVLQTLGVLEAGAAHAQVELLALATFDLVAAQAEEEFGVAEVRVHCLPHAQIEGLQDARQTQLLEDGDELVTDGHGFSPLWQRGSR